MAYTLEEFITDCRAALQKDPGPKGREAVKDYVAKACADADFLAANVHPDQAEERHMLYQDPDLGFCILSHVYRGAKSSQPHDHASSWAIYGQTFGTTQMADWRVIERPRDGKAGKVVKIRDYSLSPGVAYLYNEGDLHSPSRSGPTRLIRIEGMNMLGVKRDKYEPVAA